MFLNLIIDRIIKNNKQSKLKNKKRDLNIIFNENKTLYPRKSNCSVPLPSLNHHHKLLIYNNLVNLSDLLLLTFL